MGYFKEQQIKNGYRNKLGSSRAPVEVEFTGLENLNEILNKLPERYAKKPVQAAMRKGAAIFTADLRKSYPVYKWNGTRKAIGVKPGKGRSITVGFRTGGSYMPAWFKAYWANYGTLEHRDQGHQFVKGRLAKSSGWKGGIRALGFVEKSWERTKNRVADKIAEIEMDETQKFLQKHAYKS